MSSDHTKSTFTGQRARWAIRLLLVVLTLGGLVFSLRAVERSGRPKHPTRPNSAGFELEFEWVMRRPIIFIGDSVTRYQYLSLAYRLSHGHWQFEEPGFNKTTEIIDRDWHDWERFMRGTNALLKGNEVCDCYRNGTWDWTKTVEYIENRYFKTPHYTMTFFQAYDDRPGVCHTKGRLFPEKGAPYFDAPLDWCYTIPALLDHIDKTYGQSIIVLNLGIHGSDYVKWATAFARHSTRSGSILIWKQTTPSSDGRMPESKDFELFNIFKSSKVVVMPTWRMLTDLYNADNSAVFYDRVHFLPHINKLMNQKLAEIVKRELGKRGFSGAR
ncbi:uncharacterized protein BJ171DRAFT_214606 [Polychytrium aggregatum]|uniref:uncharacterized protein n=1 Tax=Polychytrium aggregatum TaxID=110093 RepID=UPI0022FE6AF8|nr:uncharacterized protein BJ171DRAFT_214606 [Polychytrium aggregatum]KAI9199484.1 hypothetical protein BJ171DRAFT_214606 [Polychytrium aggregatum]